MSNLQFIAEIGVNHLGDFSKALEMVKRSKEIGCTAVKFQKYDPLSVLGANSPYLQDAHQFTWGQINELSKLSHSLGLLFGCSVFDISDISIVDKFVDFHKIATRMNLNKEFIERTISMRKLTYMSISSYRYQSPIHKIHYLWCVAKYPSTMLDCLNYVFDDRHGLSSHCPDKGVVVEAFSRGATAFEVHVKQNKDEKGCDMSSSLTFDDYSDSINEIKRRAKNLEPTGR